MFMGGAARAQGIKRLLTFMQRCFPTDPSRSVDFDGHRDAAYGAAGGGSDKLVRCCTRLFHNSVVAPPSRRLHLAGHTSAMHRIEKFAQCLAAGRGKWGQLASIQALSAGCPAAAARAVGATW